METDRTFRDNNGIEWHVTEAADGWLSFEAGSMERRLSPFPAGWHSSTIQRLEQMCRIATPVQRDQTAIASHRSRVSPDVASPAPTADLAAEVVRDDLVEPVLPESDHVSYLANKWPSRVARITFRG